MKISTAKVEEGSGLTEIAFVLVIILIIEVSSRCDDCLKPPEELPVNPVTSSLQVNSTPAETPISSQGGTSGGDGMKTKSLDLMVEGDRLVMKGKTVTADEVIALLKERDFNNISMQASPGVAQIMRYAYDNAYEMTIK